MNNLIDKFFSKVDQFASRPGRLMEMMDAVLRRVAPKEFASAACPTWVETCYTCCAKTILCGLCMSSECRGRYKSQRRCTLNGPTCNILSCTQCYCWGSQLSWTGECCAGA
jgi:hypothetical protein